MKYCLRFDESVIVPQKGNEKIKRVKVAIWIIVAIIILSSFIFRSNIFAELGWTARLLLISMAVGSLFIGNKNTDVPSPLEIQFYDTYLIIYRPKYVFNLRTVREEVNIFYYADITQCLLKTTTNRLHIYGKVSVRYTNYDSNGLKAPEPTEVKTVDSGGVWIRLRFVENLDIVAEIEAHSPIRVEIENS